MPNEDKILKYNHGEKSLKAPFMIYAGSECLLENIYSCQNNLEKTYTELFSKVIALKLKCQKDFNQFYCERSRRCLNRLKQAFIK